MLSCSHQTAQNQIFVYTKRLHLVLTVATSRLKAPVLHPFPCPYWLNNSSEVRFGPEVTLPSPTLSRTVLRTGPDISVANVYSSLVQRYSGTPSRLHGTASK